MSLQIEVYKSDQGRCQIELDGRLDTHTSPSLESRLELLRTEDFSVKVVDMKNLNYISSAGLRCLLKAKKDAAADGVKFLLVNLQPQVKKVLDIIKALPACDIFANNAELDDYLHKIQKQSHA